MLKIKQKRCVKMFNKCSTNSNYVEGFEAWDLGRAKTKNPFNC